MSLRLTVTQATASRGTKSQLEIAAAARCCRLGSVATLRISSPEVTSTSASVGDSLIEAFIIFPHWTVIYSGQGSEALSINSSCLPRVRVTS